MSWKKLGQIYNPIGSNRHPKLLTHASNPLPIHIEGDIYRIFYSGRDEQNRSSVGAVDVDIERRIVVKEYPQPFFKHGHEGSFYSDGVSIGNCYMANNVRYMLFMGWQNPKGGHWKGDIGRLIVHPDLTLELDTDTPFIGIDDIDPISLSYPWVLQEEDGNFKMWYGSTIAWDGGNGEMLHVIKEASSVNGNDWDRQGLILPYKVGVAQAFSRPTVTFKKNKGYDMWFSYRSGKGETYRIGHSTSKDGKLWSLDLQGGLNVSANGWDSEMVEYPFVFDHQDRRYMLYNGNQYGRSGFGLATFIES